MRVADAPKTAKSAATPVKLTRKQDKFVSAYLETGNGTEAARQAGYQQTEGAMRVQACENLKKPAIQAAINDHLRQEDITDRLIVEELAKKIVDPNPFISMKALELLGKYRKLFTDKVDHSHVLEQVQNISWGKPNKD